MKELQMLPNDIDTGVFTDEAPVPNLRPMYYQDAIDTFKLIQEKEQGKFRKNNQPLFYMDTDDYICMIIPAVNMVINFN